MLERRQLPWEHLVRLGVPPFRFRVGGLLIGGEVMEDGQAVPDVLAKDKIKLRLLYHARRIEPITGQPDKVMAARQLRQARDAASAPDNDGSDDLSIAGEPVVAVASPLPSGRSEGEGAAAIAGLTPEEDAILGALDGQEAAAVGGEDDDSDPEPEPTPTPVPAPAPIARDYKPPVASPTVRPTKGKK